MASSPINLFLWLTKHIHVSVSSNQTDNTKFSIQGHVVDFKARLQNQINETS